VLIPAVCTEEEPHTGLPVPLPGGCAGCQEGLLPGCTRGDPRCAKPRSAVPHEVHEEQGACQGDIQLVSDCSFSVLLIRYIGVLRELQSQ
jgi:hypothetical protein